MRNSILALRVGDGLVEGMTEVRHVMFNFPSNHFKKLLLDYPRLNGIDFSYLLEEDNVVYPLPFLFSKLTRQFPFVTVITTMVLMVSIYPFSGDSKIFTWGYLCDF